jgi:tetratricopeptide (TPR) repeat protein
VLCWPAEHHRPTAGFRLLASGLCLLAFLTLSLSAADLTEARALIDSKRIPEAKPILEKIAAAEPGNADALLLLGRCLACMGRRDEAMPVLEKAAALQTSRADILAELGVVYLEEARLKNSLSLMRKGRWTIEKALEIDPGNMLAHEGLFGFFSNAPWLVGGSMDKAYRQALAIREHNPQRGLVLMVGLKNKEKKYAESFALCHEVLKQTPDDYTALYEIGLTASLSGERTDEALVSLEKCFRIIPPPGVPGHAGVHYRIGLILQAKGAKSKAAEHFAAGLALDPRNEQLLDAQARLKQACGFSPSG